LNMAAPRPPAKKPVPKKPSVPKLNVPVRFGVGIGVQPEVHLDYRAAKTRTTYGAGWTVGGGRKKKPAPAKP